MFWTLSTGFRLWMGWMLLGGVVIVFATPVEAATVVISDGNFFDQAWDRSVAVRDRVGDTSVSPLTSTGVVERGFPSVFRTGNPGSFQQHTNTLDPGDVVFGWAFHTGQLYDPSAQGAIQSFEVQLDFRVFCCGGTGWFLALQQDGIDYFIRPRRSFDNPDWQTAAWTVNLAEDLFDTQLQTGLPPDGNQPNFTVSGSPIAFGYGLGQRLVDGGMPGAVVIMGVDNWQVTINPVPEPRAALLLLTAAGAVLRRKH